jgi:hypothetical protein
MARWAFTVRRVRFLATSCEAAESACRPNVAGRGRYLRDALLVLPPVEDGPRNAARVLALKEKAFGLAILEPEDLAVPPNVEFALLMRQSIRPSAARRRDGHGPSLGISAGR